jgi:hypothetical protein
MPIPFRPLQKRRKGSLGAFRRESRAPAQFACETGGRCLSGDGWVNGINAPGRRISTEQAAAPRSIVYVTATVAGSGAANFHAMVVPVTVAGHWIKSQRGEPSR